MQMFATYTQTLEQAIPLVAPRGSQGKARTWLDTSGVAAATERR
jgi:hypothetical protein